MKNGPFWRYPKLAGKPLASLPSRLRTLLKVSKFVDFGAGPRTLDSVLSYIPTINLNGVDSLNRKIFSQKSWQALSRSRLRFQSESQIQSQLQSQLPESSSNVNVLVCLSQKDFPLGLHQRLLVLLAMKGIKLDRVQWIITNADHLGEYPSFPNDPGPLAKSNMKLWRENFQNELDMYLQNFKSSKLSSMDKNKVKNGNLFHTDHKHLSDSAFESIENYTVPLDNVHLFSTQLPWTVLPILKALDYNPFGSSFTYIIGQANTGKTSLLRKMMLTFIRDLKNEEGESMVSSKRISVSDVPFSSKFKVYNVPGMKIIDTPGYVRTSGSIWSHVNKFGVKLLKLPCSMTSHEWKNLAKTRRFTIQARSLNSPDGKSSKLDSEALTGVGIGGLVFIKPWVFDSDSKSGFEKLKINVTRNMPGESKALTSQKIDNKMYTGSTILKECQWNRSSVKGNRIELVLDNIGSFTATVELGIVNPNRTIYWEIWTPQRVRLLSRVWDADRSVSLHRISDVKENFTHLDLNLV